MLMLAGKMRIRLNSGAVQRSSPMPNQFQFFSTALMYFTRIPWASNAPYDERAQREALKYFPLIGWMIGTIGGGVLYAGLQVFPAGIAVVLAVSVMVMLTGAMHEDGLADSADGFGGGHSKEQVLSVMKDSCTGVFGATALILMFALKLAALIELAQLDATRTALTLAFAQATSRFAVLLIPATLDYAQTAAASKSAAMVGRRCAPSSVATGGLVIAVPLLLWDSAAAWVAVVTSLIASLGLARYFYRRIGGYTGDCLGATQQITEAVIYLTLLVIWTSG